MTAVEPLVEMRAILQDRLPSPSGRWHGEATGLPDACADAVVAGAAFHWFDHARAFPEIARILRPPGVLGLLGNGFDTSVQWVAPPPRDPRRIAAGAPGPLAERGVLQRYRARCRSASFRTSRRSTLICSGTSRSRAAASRCSTPASGRRSWTLGALWEQEPELRGRDHARLGYLTRVRRCGGLR